MKRLISIILVFIFLVIFSVSAVAQIYAQGDSYSTTDTWFTIKPYNPYFEMHYYNVNRSPAYSDLGLEYFKNDNTFFDVKYINDLGINETYFAGSYLFDFGFFIGGLYDAYSTTTIITVSPGYHLSLGGPSYLNFSLNYQTVTIGSWWNSDITSYDLRLKYFTENSKLLGEIWIPKVGNTYYDIGCNFKTSENLIVGFDLNSQGGSSYYMAGFTWTPEKLIGDAMIGKTYFSGLGDTNFFDISGMLKLTENFKLGADYVKYDQIPDAKMLLKANFSMDDIRFVFKYQLQNNSWYSYIDAGFEMSL